MKIYKGGCAVMLKMPKGGCDALENAALHWVAPSGQGGWKTVKSEDYHLTLQFIGRDLDDKSVASAIVSSFTFAPRHSSIEVKFPGTLGMLTTGKGRYMVAHVDPAGLEEMRKELSAHLAEMGVYPKDSFDFSPHVTLAEAPPTAPKTKPPPPVGPFSVQVKELVVKYGPHKMIVEM